MRIIDNTSQLLGDDLKSTVGRGARLKIAASCLSSEHLAQIAA